MFVMTHNVLPRGFAALIHLALFAILWSLLVGLGRGNVQAATTAALGHLKVRVKAYTLSEGSNDPIAAGQFTKFDQKLVHPSFSSPFLLVSEPQASPTFTGLFEHSQRRVHQEQLLYLVKDKKFGLATRSIDKSLQVQSVFASPISSLSSKAFQLQFQSLLDSQQYEIIWTVGGSSALNELEVGKEISIRYQSPHFVDLQLFGCLDVTLSPTSQSLKLQLLNKNSGRVQAGCAEVELILEVVEEDQFVLPQHWNLGSGGL